MTAEELAGRTEGNGVRSKPGEESQLAPARQEIAVTSGENIKLALNESQAYLTAMQGMLLPCPFCGGPANIIMTGIVHPGSLTFSVYHYRPYCYITDEIRTREYDTPQAAAAAWNYRTDKRRP